MSEKSRMIKFDTGTSLWLVPEELATDDFRRAFGTLISVENGCPVEWTEQEASAFKLVFEHFSTWRPI